MKSIICRGCCYKLPPHSNGDTQQSSTTKALDSTKGVEDTACDGGDVQWQLQEAERHDHEVGVCSGCVYCVYVCRCVGV